MSHLWILSKEESGLKNYFVNVFYSINCYINLGSSANFEVKTEFGLGISIMYNTNNIGPSMTPEVHLTNLTYIKKFTIYNNFLFPIFKVIIEPM